MMEFPLVVVFVLNLLSTGASAPVSDCDSLVRPLEVTSRDVILGKWTYIGDSTNMPGSGLLTKMFVSTAWINAFAGDQEDTIATVQHQKVLNLCMTVKSNNSLVNNAFHMTKPYSSTSVLLNTGCPDCLVLHSNNAIGGSNYTGLQLLSKRTKVSDTELDEFRKQAECLDLPQPNILDPTKGFCADPATSPTSEGLDLTSTVNSMTSKDFSQLDSFLGSETGIQGLINILNDFSQRANKQEN